MPNSRKVRRAALVGVALLLIGANVWWFTRGDSAPVADFELGVPLGQARITLRDDEDLPRYDLDGALWRVGGGPLSDLAGRIRPLAPSSTTSGDADRFLAIAMAANASPDDMRRTLLALARAGICNVAVVQDGDQSLTGDEAAVPVHHIVAVRADDGARVACVPRPQSAAAASSASR
ncbi:hypothetical protein [Novosphingobium decolorationis]|uniref:DUF4340 domain-containing protein n=1 Tax=Novosphingobium decolorationis TaxID=2698673 RepID=A0ABX8E9P6_9SPHN|nr:hypothetical protein [Novosphingobium decolorationis]QVM85747.1 hypothetical protein HT578_20400 [Novosphingobium decolorationis]